MGQAFREMQRQEFDVSKFLFLVSLSIFMAGMLIGASINSPQIEDHRKKPLPETFDKILLNNLKIDFSIILGGSLFGSISLILLFINGLLLGTFAKTALSSKLSIIEYLALILPHGTLEIIGFLIAGAAGFKIPYEVTRYLLGRKDYILNKRELMDYAYLSIAAGGSDALLGVTAAGVVTAQPEIAYAGVVALELTQGYRVTPAPTPSGNLYKLGLTA